MCRRTVAAMMTIPLLLTAACERQPDTTPAFPHEIRDSAGIRIIQNPRPDPDSRLGWQITAEPVFSIGSVEADDRFQLYRVDDALKLGDGRIVVANGGSHQLLVFDEAGNYLTAWGQKGDGPGDFGGEYGGDDLGWQLFWAEPWQGDSIAVCHGTFSLGSELFSVFDSQGDHGRTVNLARRYDPARQPHDICVDVLPHGSILAIHQNSRPDHRVTRLNRPELEFLVLEADGSLRVSLGVHPGAETFSYWEDHYTSFWLDRPPFKRTVVRAAWGPLTIISPTDRYEFLAYDGDGSLARIVRRDHNVRAPTQADFDAYKDDYLGPPSDTDFRKLLTAVMDVFDSEGLVQGFVETPQRLQIFEIGGDYILGKVLDELRVEYVELWPLNRGG